MLKKFIVTVCLLLISYTAFTHTSKTEPASITSKEALSDLHISASVSNTMHSVPTGAALVTKQSRSESADIHDTPDSVLNQSAARNTEVAIVTASVPTATPASLQTPTDTPAPEALCEIVLEIDNTRTSFLIEIPDSEAVDACDVLRIAYAKGYISSLTISDAYLQTMGSEYVLEMNGKKHNWVFTLNGESPLGCSRVEIQPGDTVVWAFL